MEAFRCFTPIRTPPTLLHSSEFKLLRPPKPRFSILARFMIPNLADQRTQSESDPVDGTELRNVDGEENERSRFKEELREAAKEALEWSSVCSLVSDFTSTAAGREVCRSGRLPVGRNQAESQKFLDQTASAVSLPEKLDFSGVDDVAGLVRKAVGGNILGIRELCAVGKCLASASGVWEQLTRVSSMEEGFKLRSYPLLDILQNCDFLTELVNKIGFCIDCNLSVILDRASTRLETIRTERRQNMDKLEVVLKNESVKVFQAGGVDSPLITKRRTRMCIGVKASHRSLLPKGVVLSVSSSGATYFMEPNGAVQLNNAEVILSNSEKDEELAILGILTYEIAQSEMRIRHLMEKIVELDLACARGAYALQMDGVCPIFYEGEKELLVDIEGIHHPLLLQPFITHSSSGVCPVPVDIKIEPAIKVVVISGPNTGGKTATLKILGLTSLMSKAGMFLPAKKNPGFHGLTRFLQILVTTSGHISRVCKIIQVTTKESLVLIDEIGSGTDPSEGLALSSSILQHLAECVNLVVVTTHYADLSLLKASDSRFKNAAMEFCTKTLRPTYRVLWGSTGNSNAFDIAMSTGFDLKVLDRAREWAKKLAPDKQMERQGLLYQSLVEERSALECQAKEAASLLLDVKQLYHEPNNCNLLSGIGHGLFRVNDEAISALRSNLKPSDDKKTKTLRNRFRQPSLDAKTTHSTPKTLDAKAVAASLDAKRQ
ncbi:DNA mismatch repair protein MSH6 [Platanthera guangdongensis]|uniref:DNA mismatch repair protein MSH6 n=1 Tax=Platanthera guangdongensis TaxID=2320717 RepID=A0ABR2LQ16_9ASPA